MWKIIPNNWKEDLLFSNYRVYDGKLPWVLHYIINQLNSCNNFLLQLDNRCIGTMPQKSSVQSTHYQYFACAQCFHSLSHLSTCANNINKPVSNNTESCLEICSWIWKKDREASDVSFSTCTSSWEGYNLLWS